MTRARPYNREAALDAAMTLFWQKGYHATSLKDLEGALAMKPGSIYAAFESKENLFLLSLEHYFIHNRAIFRAMTDAASNPLEGLANFLRANGKSVLEDTTRSACMLTKSLLNATSEDTLIAQKVSYYLEQMEAEMAAVFEHAKQIGQLPPEADVQRLARRYQSNLTALKIEGQRQIDPDQLRQSAEEMARDVELLDKRQAQNAL